MMSTTSAQTATSSRAAAPEPTPPGGWLTAEQQQHWRAFRSGVARLTAVLEHELLERTGLSTHEYEVLVRLSERPGRTMRMSELADGLVHSRSRLTHTIRRMEDAGLVARTPCAEDARGVNCTLTERGWARLVDAAPEHVQSVRDHLVDVLTPEQFAALGAAMQVVSDRIVSGPCADAAGGPCHTD
ncbi:MarR family winged helix-turn-helix transcriptional regulator [Cellulomonas fimi]|uniref:Transcriptional regulator, MarR family n=1 Tax=Cellulomonas fimi (strain ATCC 484 / DSM 20113 / JCM 1341 / CCUG 24087 / LMG 16345 / NBRC 15513 / NCIMB 8980 / NCTC 7547 / NRS-133) TaxID=590998 RepID=F4H0S5_CELFA|nr:transcriptional regulator, MarR family [Cellulomonas fimi ATCC 484]VEH28082.1 homoprotocatechuate degradation operon regulator, HpaR [Cellulomonas fimi]